MRHSVRTLDDILIVTITGAVGSHTAGQLYDLLVDCTGNGSRNLVMDLSGVHEITRAGVRGLIVAAKLLKPFGGEMRICGAQRPIEAAVRSFGFHHLLKCDPTLQASLALLRDGDVVSFGAHAAAMRPQRDPIGVNDSAENPIIWRRGA